MQCIEWMNEFNVFNIQDIKPFDFVNQTNSWEFEFITWISIGIRINEFYANLMLTIIWMWITKNLNITSFWMNIIFDELGVQQTTNEYFFCE